MRDRKPKIYVWFLGFLVFWFPRFPDSKPENQQTTREFWFPVLGGTDKRPAVQKFSSPRIGFTEKRRVLRLSPPLIEIRRL
jgi:hypothetical protein